MVKKLFYLLTALMFLFAFTMTTTPVFAQEEEEKPVEDIEEFSLEELLNVEITTAGKTAEKIGEIPASVVVIDRKDIETYGYMSLVEILQSIPGLYHIDDLDFKNFGVRGSYSEVPNRNIIILVNGIEQWNDYYTASFLEEMPLPVEAIDRIEVVRGPMSVIYGTGAFFGVINIFTNQVESPVSQVSASYGSDKTLKLVARGSGKINDFQYAFNGSYLDSEGPDLLWEKMIVGGTGSTKEQLEDTSKYFNFSGKFKGFTFDSSFSEDKKEFMFLLPSLTDGSIGRYRKAIMSFGYEKKFSDKLRFSGRFNYIYQRRLYSYDWLVPDLFAEEESGSDAYKAELNLFLDPSPKVNITLGVNYYRAFELFDNVNVPALGFVNFRQQLAKGEGIVTQSIFSQFNFKISNRIKLVLGARLEQVPEYKMEILSNQGIGFIDPDLASTEGRQEGTYSYTKAEFIPRVALIFSPKDNHYIKFLYGKAINRPSFFQSVELLGTFPGADPLEPETIQTLELNYMGTLSSKFSVSLSIFRNMLDNLIFRKLEFIGGEFISYSANIGEMVTNGVELTLNTIPLKDFQLTLSGTYQDTKDKRTGYEDIKPGYSPKFLGYLKTSYFFNPDISIALTGTYVSEMEAKWDDQIQNPNGTLGARIGDKVGSYFLLNANLRFRNLFKSGLFMDIMGYNLLDKEIRYPTTTNNNLFATKGTIGNGLSFMVSLGYKFIPRP